MGTVADRSIQKQEKKPFVIRETPAWLLTHQDWISDGARKLYLALRRLADAKTGRLFIPGQGWIRLRTVERKAGMCMRTRKQYMRELRNLQAVEIHRDRVTRSVDGRNRKVLGVSQITVKQLKPPNPHEHSGSSTVQNAENEKSPQQERVSSMVQSTRVQPENSLLGCNSCTVQELHPQFLSETTSSVSPRVGDGSPSNGNVRAAAVAAASSPSGLAVEKKQTLGALQKAPIGKGEDSEPGVSVLKTLHPQVQDLITDNIGTAAYQFFEEPEDERTARNRQHSMEFYYDEFRKGCNALGLSFQEINTLYRTYLRKYLEFYAERKAKEKEPPPPLKEPEKAKPEPDLERVAIQQTIPIDYGQVRLLWDHAHDRGWSKAEVHSKLQELFGKPLFKQLNFYEYLQALQVFSQKPAKPT